MNNENEINDNAVSKKSEKQLLLELKDTNYWEIICSIASRTHNQLLQKLQTSDPNNSSYIANLQGQIVGTYGLINYVSMIIETMDERKAEEEKLNK